jgi:hypothetical protein
MRRALTILLLCISIAVNATTYYVSTSGSDGNPGTISQPWSSLQKGFNSILAGDILYIRGGTYTPSGFAIAGNFVAIGVNGKNGTSGSQYQVYAYPGENPVLDCSNITNNSYERVGILITNSSYWHVTGLEIKNCYQVSSSSPHYGGQGLLITGSNNILIENCVAHNNQGPGLGTRNVNEVTFLNCDAHDNYDPYSDIPGDNADGFDIGFNKNDGIVRCTGCRSWNNSDDGFDMYQESGYSGIYYMTNCWSWHQGYRSDGVTTGGDGNGFKYGADLQSYDGITRRYSYNCVAYANRCRGFSQESADVKMVFYNCAAYLNGLQGYSFVAYNLSDILKNNMSYRNGSSDVFQSNQTRSNNSWQNGIVVSSGDFVSTDGSEMSQTRSADGSLPNINFLHLVTGSDLIDAGTDVGLPFSGKAPDIGPFEVQVAQPVPVPAPAPVLNSVVVEDATPTILSMTYDLTLNSLIVPSVASFSVSVNSLNRTIISIAITGNKIQLTLSSSIKYGDIVNVSYTTPANNPLQTAAGGVAASITAKSVTNNCLNHNKSNDPPVIVIKNEPNSFSGFVGVIDGSGTYDPNNDILTYTWTVPANVPVSSANQSVISFLAPMVTASQAIVFQLSVSDGINVVSKSISINILPYKPGLNAATVSSVEASSYKSPDYPNNINDGNTATKWTAEGDDQWLIVKLSQPFKISHLVLAFLQGQQYESYFDVYASKDKLKWDPILNIEVSCKFSGERQVFDFPASDTGIAYSYVKYVGHGNSSNMLNIVSEFKVFGSPHPDQAQPSNDKKNVTIFPNPVTDYLNISIEEPKSASGLVRVIDHSGNIVWENVLIPNIKNVKFPINLKSGFYIVNLLVGNLTFYSQRIIVND